METKGYGYIPDTLFEAITFLASALPKRSVPTWLELLFGAMLTQAGFVLGQNWVSLALAISDGWRTLAVPVLSRLARTTGNSGKLVAAKTLLRVVRPVLRGRLATLLIDSWYMRKTLLMAAERLGYLVIGQVRKDTALYLAPPPRTGKRGRPRKYGARMTPESVALLPEIRQRLFLYSAWHTVHYRSALLSSPAFSMAAVFAPSGLGWNARMARAVGNGSSSVPTCRFPQPGFFWPTASAGRSRICSTSSKNAGAGRMPGSSPDKYCTVGAR